jgi:hypothetical protein
MNESNQKRTLSFQNTKIYTFLCFYCIYIQKKYHFDDNLFLKKKCHLKFCDGHVIQISQCVQEDLLTLNYKKE